MHVAFMLDASHILSCEVFKTRLDINYNDYGILHIFLNIFPIFLELSITIPVLI
jgi:hypothetical protein